MNHARGSGARRVQWRCGIPHAARPVDHARSGGSRALGAQCYLLAHAPRGGAHRRRRIPSDPIQWTWHQTSTSSAHY
jgi:hypothetical protein